MITFSCNHCDAKFNVPEGKAGKSALCPKCSKPIRIPAPSGAAARRGLGPDDTAGSTALGTDAIEAILSSAKPSVAERSETVVPERQVEFSPPVKTPPVSVISRETDDLMTPEPPSSIAPATQANSTLPSSTPRYQLVTIMGYVYVLTCSPESDPS
jgi:hypothetical protein